ncbi:MAG: hypothetical protein IJ789_07705 [Bacteroidales bacterium]|nr:hypothetical protein [Bacteroidales bacterium]
MLEQFNALKQSAKLHKNFELRQKISFLRTPVVARRGGASSAAILGPNPTNGASRAAWQTSAAARAKTMLPRMPRHFSFLITHLINTRRSQLAFLQTFDLVLDFWRISVKG